MRIAFLLLPDEERSAADSATTLEMFLVSYYVFVDADAEVVLASPTGGWPELGLARDEQDTAPAVVRRFRSDRAAREELSDTLGLDQVCTTDFDAAFCLGAPGSIAQDGDAAAGLIAEFLALRKPVAIIANEIDLGVRGDSKGLLIIGSGGPSSLLAAYALLGSVRPDAS